MLLREMDFTQVTTKEGFILTTLAILAIALWMFHRLLFVSMSRLVTACGRWPTGDVSCMSIQKVYSNSRLLLRLPYIRFP